MIELLVVCAIIIVITSVVLVDNNRFGGEVTLQNLSYDVALSLRQTQEYGIAVEGFNGSFTQGYGMHFSMSDPTHYILFADIKGTGVYTLPSENVSPSPYTIQQGYFISDLCVESGSGEECYSKTGGFPDSIDILYRRPEPEAYISAGSGETSDSCIQNSSCYPEAEITLTSPKGSTSTVVVYASGQISVQ